MCTFENVAESALKACFMVEVWGQFHEISPKWDWFGSISVSKSVNISWSLFRFVLEPYSKIGDELRRTYRQLTPTARRQFFVSVIQPDLEYAASATIPFMPTGQQDRLLALWKKAVRCLAGVHPQDDVLPLIRNLKLTLLSHRWSLQLFTTIRRRHQQSAPALLLEKVSFHEHQHSTRGRQQGDFRPFQPVYPRK